MSPSQSVLVCSPAFPCSSQSFPVCQYVQAPPMILFGPAQCLRRRIVLLCPLAGPLLPAAFPQCVFPILSQLSAFSCCSPSSKCPSFDSQYLQLVAAPPTTSSPSYAWWSHLVSSCFSPVPPSVRFLPFPVISSLAVCSPSVSCLCVLQPIHGHP